MSVASARMAPLSTRCAYEFVPRSSPGLAIGSDGTMESLKFAFCATSQLLTYAFNYIIVRGDGKKIKQSDLIVRHGFGSICAGSTFSSSCVHRQPERTPAAGCRPSSLILSSVLWLFRATPCKSERWTI